MSMDTRNKLIKIFNGKVVTLTRLLENAYVMIKDGVIETVAEGNPEVVTDYEIDAQGSFIGPGFIDIQINGYLGVDFADQNLTNEDGTRVCQYN